MRIPMARIAGVDIPRDKRVVISLQYIYGIGVFQPQKHFKERQCFRRYRVKDLSDEQLVLIRNEVTKYTTEGPQKRSHFRYQTFNGNRFIPRYETS